MRWGNEESLVEGREKNMKHLEELAKSFEQIFGDPKESAKCLKEIFGDPEGSCEKMITGQATEEESTAYMRYAKHQLKIFEAAIRKLKKALKEAEHEEK